VATFSYNTKIGQVDLIGFSFMILAMYFLVKQPNDDFDIFESDKECDQLVRFVETIHKDLDDDGKIMATILAKEIEESRTKITTLAHLRRRLVATSEDKEALVGTAAMERMSPVYTFNQFNGVNGWLR